MPGFLGDVQPAEDPCTRLDCDAVFPAQRPALFSLMAPLNA